MTSSFAHVRRRGRVVGQVTVSVLRGQDVANLARSTPEVRAGRVDQHMCDEVDAYGVR